MFPIFMNISKRKNLKTLTEFENSELSLRGNENFYRVTENQELSRKKCWDIPIGRLYVEEDQLRKKCGWYV